MFDGLNAIPWYDLKHAYGSGEEVPMWLRQLVLDDADLRKRAMNHLSASICHQGWICPATAYAVPFLIELLREPSIQEKHEILEPLGGIAAAEPLEEQEWREVPDVPAWREPAYVPFKDAHAAAVEGIPVYTALLDDSDIKVRMAAAQTLVRFAERADEVRLALLEALGREGDERGRTTLLLALGMLPSDLATIALLEHAFANPTSDLEQLAAAAVLASLRKSDTPEDVAELLADAMARDDEWLPEFRQVALGGLGKATARRALYELGPARLQSFVPLLRRLVTEATNNIDAWMFGELLLFAVFDGRPRKHQPSVSPEALLETQRDALVAILENASVWRIGNFTNLLHDYGLPRQRDELAAFLRREAPADYAAPAQGQPRQRPHNRYEQYASRIRVLFPDLHIVSYGGALAERGQSNDTMTADILTDPATRHFDKLIFRFPRHAHAIAEMEREVALLRELQGRLPLPVPNPICTSLEPEVGKAFMGYKKLPGKPLLRELLLSVDGEHAVQVLADQLGAFLWALHSLPLAEVCPLPLLLVHSRDAWTDLYARIRERLFPHMHPDAQAWAVAHFEPYLDDERSFAFEPVLAHGDFGPTNIIYDASVPAIGGIIDFSSAGLGDPAADLAAMLGSKGYGEDFARRLEVSYPGIMEFLPRARFYAGTFALQEALFGAEHSDAGAFARGLAPYR
jgi:aminoglycoside 2''-phosphotransferase